MSIMKDILRGAVAGLALFSAVASLQAQTFPTRALRIVVSFPAGGVTDVVARQLAEKMQESLKQPVMIDNKPGGALMIGVDAVAKSPADGYTLYFGPDSVFTLNPLVIPKLPYDYQRDFTSVSLVSMQSLFFVGSTKAPGKSLSEVISYAKANPGKVTFGTSAQIPQLMGEHLKLVTGTDMLSVPYRGSPQMVAALLSNEIDFSITTFFPYASYVKEGKMKGLAVSGTSRESPVPDAPTLAELGYPEVGFRTWLGLFAPAGTPKDIVRKLNEEVVKAMSDPALRKKLIDIGAEPATSTPEQLDGMLRADLERWGKVVKVTGIKFTN